MAGWYQRPSMPPRRTFPLVVGLLLSAGLVGAAAVIWKGWA